MKRLIVAGVGTLVGCFVAAAASAHPNHGTRFGEGGRYSSPGVGQTVIANFPINGTKAVVVPTAPLAPRPVPAPLAVPLVTKAGPVVSAPKPVIYVPAPRPVRPTPPRPLVYAAGSFIPTDCVCARSATGKRVNVFATAGRWHASPQARIGGGKALIDVYGFHQGHWRVGYYPKGTGESIEYGWVRQADLVCKETRGFHAPPVLIQRP